jgi:predicted CXXCH cytochrome family protein
MSTWNSTEYSDAMRGSCYSQLTCTQCHDPHETPGQGWTRPPVEDDAICLTCHQQFNPPSARMAHTRHPMESEGARCMNCHLPRMNEGLQEVVRTHMIFSPTNRAMIESNQPNACNQCHVDQSIQWTLAYLKEWYGTSYSDWIVKKNYPAPEGPAALGWLESTNQSVRLIAADCLTRAEAHEALPELIDALDDPFLLNRQFAEIGLERMLGIRLSDFDYHFYQTPDERKSRLNQLRLRYVPPESSD